MSALGSFPDPSQAIWETWRALEVSASPGMVPRPLSGHQGDLDGPSSVCQPWNATQAPIRPSGKPGGPLKWVPALESYPAPSKAIKETWWALEIDASPGELPRPFLGHQGDLERRRGGFQPRRATQAPIRPRGPLKWVPALKSYPGPSQAIKET